jgi:hypothetical protein
MIQKNLLEKKVDIEEKINLFEAETTTEEKLILQLRNIQFEIKTLRDEQRKIQKELEVLIEIVNRPNITKEVVK